MPEYLRRQFAIMFGLLVCGFAMVFAANAWTSPLGGYAASMLQSESPAFAVFATVGCFVAATAAAIVVGRVTNTAVGLFVLGGGLFALDYRLAGLHDLAGHGSLGPLPLETLLWALLVLSATFAMFKLSGVLEDVAPDEHDQQRSAYRSADAWKSAACGLIMIPALWLIAQSAEKGQAVGAAIAGGVLAGLAARLLAPHVQPILVVSTTVIAGAIAHVLASTMTSGALAEAIVLQSESVFAHVMPIDIAVGALVGVPIGFGWAKSFLHEEVEEHAHARHA